MLELGILVDSKLAESPSAQVLLYNIGPATFLLPENTPKYTLLEDLALIVSSTFSIRGREARYLP